MVRLTAQDIARMIDHYERENATESEQDTTIIRLLVSPYPTQTTQDN